MSGECGTCEAELPTGLTLCWKHTTHLVKDLANVKSVWVELQITAARLDAGAKSEIRGGSARQEAANLDALDKGQTLQVVLGGWASMIPWAQPIGDLPKLALWLMGENQVTFIRKQDWAAELKRELADSLRACSKLTDNRAPQKVFAGMCPTITDGGVCDTAVFTKPGQVMAQCRNCEAVWDVSEWRARALDLAMIETGTPLELSRMLSNDVTGEALPSGTIRSWISRGKLKPIDRNEDSKPVYQVRKVRNLWKRAKEAKQVKQEALEAAA